MTNILLLIDCFMIGYLIATLIEIQHLKEILKKLKRDEE